ncbi:hypothetical protein HK101_011872, partial [Irineochytrium annulatum]
MARSNIASSEGEVTAFLTSSQTCWLLSFHTVRLVGRTLEEVRERRDQVCVSFREVVDSVGETYEGSEICPRTWDLKVLDGGDSLWEDHDFVVGNPVAKVFEVVADEVTFGKAAVEFVVSEP